MVWRTSRCVFHRLRQASYGLPPWRNRLPHQRTAAGRIREDGGRESAGIAQRRARRVHVASPLAALRDRRRRSGHEHHSGRRASDRRLHGALRASCLSRPARGGGMGAGELAGCQGRHRAGRPHRAHRRPAESHLGRCPAEGGYHLQGTAGCRHPARQRDPGEADPARD